MLEAYSVMFAGHRYIENYAEIEGRLYQIISDFMRKKDYIEFYVGDQGEFDQMATICIRRAKKNVRNDNSSLNLVLPYSRANMGFVEKNFDSIIVPHELQGIHPKRAISARNRWMVDRSDLLISYVTRHNGGAWQTHTYAQKKRIEIINLGEVEKTD